VETIPEVGGSNFRWEIADKSLSAHEVAEIYHPPEKGVKQIP
jgi:hypothetical protein